MVYASTKEFPPKGSFFIGLDIVNVDGDKLNISPGDTILLQAGVRDHLRFANIHGDSLNVITIINESAEVIINTQDHYFGIQFHNCSHFRLTGSGDAEVEYGIKIIATPAKTNGLSLGGLSTDFEIDHLEISNTGFAGIFALTQPDCSGKTTRGNFVMRNTSYHDNYIHDTYGEGFYIGHSFYTGYTVKNNGKDTTLLPHEIKGVSVFRNKLERCGYDAIQLSCATENCEIYENEIIEYGYQNEKFQNSGIQIGGGSTGKCYNNSIIKGTGNGINVFGIGNNFIYNNIIIYPGYDIIRQLPQQQPSYGIFCDDRATVKGYSFNFINNTIIAPGSDGIRIYTKESSDNKLYNNLILKPGSMGLYENTIKSYINVSDGVDAILSNNYYSIHLSPYFDYTSIDQIYEYCCSLDIKDKGTDVWPLGVFTDFGGNTRSLDGLTDMGALELRQDDYKGPEQSKVKVYSKGTNGEIIIDNTHGDKIKSIGIYTITGDLLNIVTSVNDENPKMTIHSGSNNKMILIGIFTDYSNSMHKIVF